MTQGRQSALAQLCRARTLREKNRDRPLAYRLHARKNVVSDQGDKRSRAAPHRLGKNDEYPHRTSTGARSRCTVRADVK